MYASIFKCDLWVYSQRMSHYAGLRFSDEEVITLYLFGIIDKNRELKRIYEYAGALRPWFSKLPQLVRPFKVLIHSKLNALLDWCLLLIHI